MAHPVPVPVVTRGRRAPVAGDLAARVLVAARSAGLDAAGLAPATPMDATRADLVDRRDRGLSAGMQFTFRNPDRSTDPSRVVEGARAIVVGARAYPGPWAPAGTGPEPTPETGEADRGGPRGQVAAYARGNGYTPLRQALRTVADLLKGEGWRAVVVCDDNAMVDRAAAHRAGLGWFGKNALLFVPGLGSRVVLGSVVTDAPLLDGAATGEDSPLRPHGEGCRTCTRCLDGCPTGALVEPGVVDARRCLAWLVQAPGSFPVEHRAALGGRIYGCDECQRVCPINRLVERRQRSGPAAGPEAEAEPEAEFEAEPEPVPAAVDLLGVLAATDDEVLARFGRWYLPGRDPNVVRRNVLVALGNVADPADARVRAVLGEVADPGPGARRPPATSALLAEHARWALERLDARRTTVEVPRRP